jgi:hypothetical protein
MLVMQALLGALAIGSAAADPMVDAFGNPLCVTSDQQDPSGGRDHTAMPDCCTSACSMVAPALTGERDAHYLANPLRIPAPATFDIGSRAAQPAPDHDPGSPRAPPLKG